MVYPEVGDGGQSRHPSGLPRDGGQSRHPSGPPPGRALSLVPKLLPDEVQPKHENRLIINVGGVR